MKKKFEGDVIYTGDIPMGTVQAFKQAAVAREAEDLREAFEERAGILELDAGLPRPDPEREAARLTATLAGGEGVTADTPAKKEEAGLSRAAVRQILKAAGMSLADIAECEHLAALSKAEVEAEAERRMQQIGY